jgi:hypothetical protein
MTTMPQGRRGALTALTAAAMLAGCARARDTADARDERWTTPRPLPMAGAFSGNDHRIAALGAGPGGTLHALFLDDRNGDGAPDRLLHASYDGAAWHAPVLLDETPGPTSAPLLAVDGGSGVVYAFWLEGGPPAETGDPPPLDGVLYRTLRDGAWSPVRELYRAAAGIALARSALAAAAVAGRIHVVYGRGDGGLDHAVLDSTGWRTVPAGREGAEPVLVPGPRGALALADLSSAMSPLLGGGPRANHDPWVRLLGPAGWSQPARVHVNPGGASHAPQVAWDADGGLHAVWLEADPGQLLPTHLLYARSRNGVAWSPPRELAAEAPGRVFYAPRLAVDGRGVIHLTVTRFRSGVSDPRHFHLTLRDGRWSAVRPVPGADGSDSELETVADSRGVVHAVWNGPGLTYLHATLSSPRQESRRAAQ